ncbi:temptin [Plakobranchus ocellatus]|uniref:Temptin n=1 Tax=Plakobranchus ocellatus TaxID=259542 RepID=A0AAV3ZYN5_9GAST|nr:temptin [Plakobranchus ocellatus]
MMLSHTKTLTPSWLLLLTLMLATEFSVAWPSNRDLLPNGYNIPDPCRPGRTAQGVGHVNADGGGPVNDFGQAFQDAGSWTPSLCAADTDGDGVTNGAELGDPSCTWSPGQTPQSTESITHPGIHNTECNCPLPPWLWSILFGWTVIFE